MHTSAGAWQAEQGRTGTIGSEGHYKRVAGGDDGHGVARDHPWLKNLLRLKNVLRIVLDGALNLLHLPIR
jgi:hypothetical protein